MTSPLRRHFVAIGVILLIQCHYIVRNESATFLESADFVSTSKDPDAPTLANDGGLYVEEEGEQVERDNLNREEDRGEEILPLRHCKSHSVEVPKSESAVIRLSYICKDENYKEFVKRMNPLVESIVHGNTSFTAPPTDEQRLDGAFRIDPKKWGRRPEAIPANKTVLIMGNSHTRQLVENWACMYQDQIVSMKKLSSARTNQMGGVQDKRIQIQFQNGAKIFSVVNSPISLMSDWGAATKELIGAVDEDGAKQSVTIDAILLGTFNTPLWFEGVMGSTFARDMIRLSKTMPQLDFPNRPAPTLTEVLHTFQNDTTSEGNPIPVVLAGMFAANGHKWKHHVLNETRHHYARSEKKAATPVHIVPTRRFIPYLGESAGVGDRKNSPCRNVSPLALSRNKNYYHFDISTDSRKPSTNKAHRCAGVQGSIPGLAVWDIMEALHDAWNIQRKRGGQMIARNG